MSNLRMVGQECPTYEWSDKNVQPTNGRIRISNLRTGLIPHQFAGDDFKEEFVNLDVAAGGKNVFAPSVETVVAD